MRMSLMNASIKTFTVTIHNERYHLASDENEAHVLEVAQRVDQEMRNITQQLGIDDVKRVAVLVALRFADQLLTGDIQNQEMNDSLDRLKGMIEDQMQQLSPKED